MGNLSTCALVVRFIFILINLPVLLLGLAVLAIGIYSQVEVSSGDYSYLAENEGAPAILIVSGVITCIVTGIGIGGACMKSKVLLVIYAIILAIAILLQLAGILGFVYRDYNKETLESNYADRLTDAIKEYDEDKSARKAINTLQENAKCCGVYGPEDWAENGKVIESFGGELPESCQCSKINRTNCMAIEPFDYYYYNNSIRVNETYDSDNTVWIKGCYNETVSAIEALYTIYGGIGLGVALFEVTVLIMAIGLVVCIVKSTKQYEVV